MGRGRVPSHGKASPGVCCADPPIPGIQCITYGILVSLSFHTGVLGLRSPLSLVVRRMALTWIAAKTQYEQGPGWHTSVHAVKCVLMLYLVRMQAVLFGVAVCAVSVAVGVGCLKLIVGHTHTGARNAIAWRAEDVEVRRCASSFALASPPDV